MNSQPIQSPSAADEAAIRQIPFQMIDAWNNGSGAGFAAPFTEFADFVAFEGTHLRGVQQIATFHQQLFDTTLKGSRLTGEVKFVRFINPELAVMHAVGSTLMPGENASLPSRDSMQIFVVAKHENHWRVESLLNARRLTLQRQFFLDDLDSLPVEDQRTVMDMVASLKQRHSAER